MSLSHYREKHLLVLKFVNIANARTPYSYNVQIVCIRTRMDVITEVLQTVAISGIFLCQNFTEGGSSVQWNAMFI